MATSAFFDYGYPPGRAFSKFFFTSPDFQTTTLKSLTRARPQASKDAIAEELAKDLDIGALDPDAVIRALALQPRQWLSLKIGRAQRLPSFRPANDLLTSLGVEEWYGPIMDSGGTPRWYIRPFHLDHYAKQGDRYTQGKIRWLVFAEVSANHIAFSWNGFTIAATSGTKIPTQFDFWQYIPTAMSELESLTESHWREPLLHKIVLEDIWDEYSNDPLHEWKHLRIRAELSGVALNAHSSSKVDVRGLEALTNALARSAMGSLSLQPDPEKISIVERALLQTIIREWGTNSYEFKLSQRGEAGEKPSTLFRAHCYFGLRTNLKTQDALQHLRCYSSEGGHTAARDFIMRYVNS